MRRSHPSKGEHMTITSQQVDAWDAEVDAAYEAGRQEGMKQERALWELSRLGQEIEAQPEQKPAAFPNRRAVEREIERIQNPKGMHLNDGKERVILPGGTLRYLLALADRATSPQRPWVGLTDEDKQNLAAAQLGWEELIEAVEAKLKEKNQ